MDEWSVILWCLTLLQSVHLMLVRLSLVDVDKARVILMLEAGIRQAHVAATSKLHC